jgi:hypothetical protein
VNFAGFPTVRNLDHFALPAAVGPVRDDHEKTKLRIRQFSTE